MATNTAEHWWPPQQILHLDALYNWWNNQEGRPNKNQRWDMTETHKDSENSEWEGVGRGKQVYRAKQRWGEACALRCLFFFSCPCSTQRPKKCLGRCCWQMPFHCRFPFSYLTSSLKKKKNVLSSLAFYISVDNAPEHGWARALAGKQPSERLIDRNR